MVIKMHCKLSLMYLAMKSIVENFRIELGTRFGVKNPSNWFILLLIEEKAYNIGVTRAT